MKRLACYKKSASSTNMWLSNVFRIVSLLSRSIAIFFMQLMKLVIMPPTLKKWGAYWFQLVRSSVRSSIRPFVRSKQNSS